MADIETANGAAFWEQSTDTHKAGDDYYRMVATALEDLVVPALRPETRMLDFGCGNGEYTRLLARHCRLALGVDVSAPLIDEATRASADDPTLRWQVGTMPPADETFDVVACMGVFVCLLADADFRALLDAIARCVSPGGLLVLRETLSWTDPQLVEHDDYVAHYRTPLDYLRPLADAGIQLVHDEHLVTWSDDEQRSNHLWLLQRPG